MSQEKLKEALNEISDKHLTEAAQPKSRRPYWLGAVAAALAVVMLAAGLGLPQSQEIPGNTEPPKDNSRLWSSLSPFLQAKALLAEPEYPEMAPYPNSDSGWDYDADKYDRWRDSQRSQYNQPDGYADSLKAYFTQSINALLADDSQNQVCSPVNIYMALAMLAECTDGTSQQEILALLGADSMEALRTQAGHVWNAHYCDDNASTSLLANSLWLDSAFSYRKDTVKTLADSYFASVYQGDLGSQDMNLLLQKWLNDNTGGLLKTEASSVELSPDTMLSLASTIYYRAKWCSDFDENATAEAIFHAPEGDITRDFMHQTLVYGPYYYGKDYSAVRLGLEDGSAMWLILPDEGYSPQDLLKSGHALKAVLDPDSQSFTRIKVNLSVPKFDVTANRELSEALKALGIRQVFKNGDFSPIITTEEPVWLDRVEHAARVKIDEEGVEAAAYTVMIMCGAAMPPEEEVDFVLDRPFLFVISSRDDLPLFAGVVNNP